MKGLSLGNFFSRREDRQMVEEVCIACGHVRGKISLVAFLKKSYKERRYPTACLCGESQIRPVNRSPM